MTAKERANARRKVISTITQLSYGYRPRRRKRIKPTAPRRNPPIKHDHKLKALAIKKAQIHVVGSRRYPSRARPFSSTSKVCPTAISITSSAFDTRAQGTHVERSFWADGPEDECDIWQECLRALKEIDNPRIVHYGAYESRFLKP